MEHMQIFDKQNFDKLIVGFIGEILKINRSRENFESVAIHQICRILHHQLSIITLFSIRYCVYGEVCVLLLCAWKPVVVTFSIRVVIQPYELRNDFVLYGW